MARASGRTAVAAYPVASAGLAAAAAKDAQEQAVAKAKQTVAAKAEQTAAAEAAVQQVFAELMLEEGQEQQIGGKGKGQGRLVSVSLCSWAGAKVERGERGQKGTRGRKSGQAR